MKLTKKKAREIFIELWTQLAETGAMHIMDVPAGDKVKDMEGWCPYCELFYSSGCENKCPLDNACDYGGAYDKWHDARTKKTKKKYAKLILESGSKK